VTDLINATVEELEAMKAQLGDNFHTHYPSVDNALRDPASGIVAPRTNVKLSAMDRMRAAAASKSAPKVRKGDFRVYLGKDIGGSYKLIAPSPLIAFDLACVETQDGKKDKLEHILSPELFNYMEEMSPIDFETWEHFWRAKLTMHTFFLVYAMNNEAEMAIEINMPLRDKHRNHYNNRVSALAEMESTWSFIRKVGTDPYREGKVAEGNDGEYYWEASPLTEHRDTPPHVFELDEESFQQKVIENLRIQRRYLEDREHTLVKEILGLPL